MSRTVKNVFQGGFTDCVILRASDLMPVRSHQIDRSAQNYGDPLACQMLGGCSAGVAQLSAQCSSVSGMILARTPTKTSDKVLKQREVPSNGGMNLRISADRRDSGLPQIHMSVL